MYGLFVFFFVVLEALAHDACRFVFLKAEAVLVIERITMPLMANVALTVGLFSASFASSSNAPSFAKRAFAVDVAIDRFTQGMLMISFE